MKFPSPIGVLYISIEGEELELIDSYSFRPLLGFFIFQCFKISAITDKTVVVSVPYWGLYISISNEKPNCSSLEFPSPTGVLYISIQNEKTKCNKNVSVPYWGSLYFNQTMRKPMVARTMFPSPIGVLYISIITKTRQEFWTI